MILCVGCSWTYGLGVKDSETYPAHLQDYIGKPVINAGFPGTAISHSIWTTYKLLKEYDIKIVILQLSSYDRWTGCIDGKRNFGLAQYTSGIEEYIYDSDEQASPYKRVYNASAEYHYHLLTQGKYLEHKDGNTEQDIAMTYLYENVIPSDYQYSFLCSQLDMLKSHCEYNGCKLFIFNWLEQPNPFVHNVSVYETFGDTYVIDNGYHYSNEGLRLVATDYVYPNIKEYI
jgi:hypothetical protein